VQKFCKRFGQSVAQRLRDECTVIIVVRFELQDQTV
jgi:hypothetical protein